MGENQTNEGEPVNKEEAIRALQENDNNNQDDEPPPLLEAAPANYTTRSGQTIIPNQKYATMAIQEKVHKPSTYKEAVKSPTHRCQWSQAIDEELKSLAANRTWELVELSGATV